MSGSRWFRATALVVSVLVSGCRSEPARELTVTEGANADMFSESQAYDRFMGRWSRELAPHFVEFAGIGQHGAVLDVGSGTGELSLAVLATAEPAQVIGIDPSATYVDYARSRSTDTRVRFETGDGQALRFDDATFDATMSLLVLNFIPDPEKALGEMIRVTRPGGVVAAAVWDYDEGMEMLRVFWDAAVASNPAAADRDERRMRFAREGELGDLWRQAGLTDVVETPLVIAMRFESFDDFWSPFLAGQGPAGSYVMSLSDDGRSAIERRLRERLANEGTDEITLKGRAWAVRGIKSGG